MPPLELGIHALGSLCGDDSTREVGLDEAERPRFLDSPPVPQVLARLVKGLQ